MGIAKSIQNLKNAAPLEQLTGDALMNMKIHHLYDYALFYNIFKRIPNARKEDGSYIEESKIPKDLWAVKKKIDIDYRFLQSNNSNQSFKKYFIKTWLGKYHIKPQNPM